MSSGTFVFGVNNGRDLGTSMKMNQGTKNTREDMNNNSVFLHKYILTLYRESIYLIYARMGSWEILDIPPKHPNFTKTTQLSVMLYLYLSYASEGMLIRLSWQDLQALAATNPHWARVVVSGPYSLCVIHKEDLYLYSGLF
jgi:hypothetical protein